MLQKLKDGANKLKAKIGGDELDEKLTQVVSEQNWQASTQQLHEVANAAYNYQKWQRISEFIWDKLKKSKSWRKILKTLNLIEFLLKNGPQSIISNFRYDIYQLRTFESYSNYVDGVDKGQTIRERAKAVVNLLSNEQQLEEERVKAKAIRQKMANVVGGTTYGNSGSYGSYNDSYGYGSKQQKQKNNYATTTGAFGDYTYNKSTLDKYKDSSKNDKSVTHNQNKKEQKKIDVAQQSKKPFEKIANKLSKPGEKKVEETAPNPVKPIAKSNNEIIDLFGDEPVAPQTSNPTAPHSVIQPLQQTTQQHTQYFPTQQAPQVPTYQPPPQAQPITYQQPQVPIYQQPPQLQVPTYQLPQQAPIYQQPPQIPIYQQPPQVPIYQQPAQQLYQPNQLPYQQPPQQPSYNQLRGIPNQYAAFNPQNQFGYPLQQQPTVGQNFFNNPGVTQNPLNPYGSAPYAPNAASNGNLGITLSTNKPLQNNSTTLHSGAGTAQNVKWLSNKQKGLIDFSDFSSQIKKETVSDSKGQSAPLQLDNWW